MSYHTINYYKDKSIGYLMFNRPETHNAQSIEMLEEIDSALNQAEQDQDIRVLVIGGEGESFSSGHDLKEMVEQTNMEYVKQREIMETRYLVEEDYYYKKCLKIRNFPKPTIAQIQGHCLAAGLMLAGMCDIIVASSDAQFGNPVGRMAAIGVEVLVEPWELPIRLAKEMLFTGNSICADTAYKHGMINRVVPREDLEREVNKIAEQITLMPSFAIRMTKKSINATIDLMGQRDAWDHHFNLHQICHETQEWESFHGKTTSQKKDLKHFLEKRDGEFNQ